jgi:N-acetyl-anhydromuramyl-L-alanine amidase AmpD
VSAAGQSSSAPKIIDKFIDYGTERQKLTIEYRKAHQDLKADSIKITPRMIVLHYTVIPTFDATWKYFNNIHAETARTALAGAGDVNVSAQFVVDRDGTIYRLMPERDMARHCIGLNHVAIGVENVGDADKLPLTDAQVESNAKLVRYLARKYRIEYLIGHEEYRRMEGVKFSDGEPVFLELDPKYRNQKQDPGGDFMKRVRSLVQDLGLKGPPEGI